MNARTHEANAVATFLDMPESFKQRAFGKALTRLQSEEWQLYTVIPDRVDGDNIVYGFFHSHKYEFDAENEKPVFIKIKGKNHPKYLKDSSHPLIFSYYIMIRKRHKEGDNLEVRQLGARTSHYIIDGMATIWHFIDVHMDKNSKMARIANYYGIPESKPIPKKILNKMTAIEREYFV